MSSSSAVETSRVPVTILTGFLGSGKTTVLNALVRRSALTRIAVIINELGEISIDHDLVQRTDESFTVVRNGCVCCTVRGDLIETLQELSRRRKSGALPALDGVIVETTGMADPAPIVHTLMNDPAVIANCGLGAVVATVDAVNGAGTLERNPEAVKQAAIADLILVTKTDLASPAITADIAQRLKALNPAARRIAVDAREIDPSVFFTAGHFALDRKSADVTGWLNAEAVAAHDHHGHHHHTHDISRHDKGIRSYCITRDAPISASGFAAWLDMIGAMRGADLLRVKGIVCVAEHPDEPLIVHGVQHVFHPAVKLARWPSEDRRTRLVFITRNIEREAIDDTLRVFENRGARRRPRSQDGG